MIKPILIFYADQLYDRIYYEEYRNLRVDFPQGCYLKWCSSGQWYYHTLYSMPIDEQDVPPIYRAIALVHI